MNFLAVQEALEKAAYRDRDSKDYAYPGAVLLVGLDGQVVHQAVAGHRSIEPELSPLSEETVFDVASLTKALVTTTLAMQLVDSGHLDVNSRVEEYFPGFGSLGKERMLVRHLLSHSGGYPAVIPFHERIKEYDSEAGESLMSTRAAVELVIRQICNNQLENLPGRETVYSDVGFILLGSIIERIMGKTLDVLAQQYIFSPLSLKSTGFVVLEKIKEVSPVNEAIAPTAKCPWRDKILCGEVHDDNAWAMGGVAGHAGLFSTAFDVHVIASALLASWHGKETIVSEKTVKEFWKKEGSVPRSTWAFGWDTPSPEGSSSGKYFSANSVGHLAFTGCSLWIDIERGLDVVLLTNRIHPDAKNQNIKEFRPYIHNLVMESLGYA